MNENYPKFRMISLAFPDQAIDYGLSTQAPVLPDDEVDAVANRLDTSEKEKLKTL